jgi:hypothetical protein
MKTRLCNLPLLIGFFLIFVPCPESFGQDSISQKSQMLDMKLQLLDSKLELLDTKIKLWEAKPKELDIKLNEIATKISSLDFDPQLMSKKFNRIDSLFKIDSLHNISQKNVSTVEVQPRVDAASEPQFVYDYKSSIMLDPVRLLGGTFYLSYERILNSRFSINVGGMATYSTKQGLSNYYFRVSHI